MSLISVRQILGCVLAVALLSGCSSTKSRIGGALNLDTDLKLILTAEQEINPDHNTRASPIIVRLYELSSVPAFEKADFVDIYERDQELLGNSLIGKHVLQAIVPGEERQEQLVLKPGTTHVGLFAEFSQYRGAGYKVVFPVTQNNVFRNVIRVGLDGTDMSLSR